ncbi:Dabb family protein [Rhodococcus sp. NPDC057529]|uniref:Dabb family protein n=1 Tax=Rhodococcus sp. NPDC057529 TaxID=3346158 RepID=UPI00366C8B52
MPFTHVVTFRWVPEKHNVADEVRRSLEELVRSLPGVHSYLCGSDAGLNPGNSDFAVVGTFASKEDFLHYRDHPEHQRILEELIVPNLAEKEVVQIER